MKDEVPAPLPTAEFDAMMKKVRASHRQMFGDVGPHPDETLQLCHCGTCMEAYEAALRTAEQLLTNDCGIWLLAVANHLQVMGRLAVMRMLTNRVDVERGTVESAIVNTAIAGVLNHCNAISSHPEAMERTWRTVEAALTAP